MKFSDLSKSLGLQEYIKCHLRTSYGLSEDQIDALPEVPDYYLRLFLRMEEFENDYRDRWDGWDHSFSENYQNGNLWRPEFDLWVSKFIGTENKGRGKWPGNNDFAVCLTHDVDCITTEQRLSQKFRKLISSFQSEVGNRKEKYIGSTVAFLISFLKGIKTSFKNSNKVSDLEKCVDLEKKYNFVSSYFFTVFPILRKSIYDCVYMLNDKYIWRGETKTVASILRSLSKEGFDVGLHGSFFSAVDKKVMFHEIEQIKGAIGSDVLTSRQHYLHWDVKITPVLHRKCNLQADSTLGYNRNIGFRAGTCHPYFYFDLKSGKQLDILQVPLIIQDVALFSPGALGLNLELAKKITLQLMDQVKSVGGVFTILFHPNYISDPIRAQYYEWFLSIVDNENAWVTSLEKINCWYRSRQA